MMWRCCCCFLCPVCRCFCLCLRSVALSLFSFKDIGPDGLFRTGSVNLKLSDETSSRRMNWFGVWVRRAACLDRGRLPALPRGQGAGGVGPAGAAGWPAWRGGRGKRSFHRRLDSGVSVCPSIRLSMRVCMSVRVCACVFVCSWCL